MDKPLISEILATANKLGSKGKRISYLQEQDCTALKDILRIGLDDTIELSLPPGEPPFKKFNTEGKDKPEELRFMYPKFRNFVKAASPNLNQFKRETVFIDLLESIHPDDAKLFCDAKDKNLKYKYITKTLVKAAFPNLISK
tara:strand:+ start:632 stop:1057 length:426 start_codon:yes stop_codon:yes gene_type:complete